MSYKTWLKTLLFFIVVLSLMIGTFNYYTDPYGIRSYDNKYILDVTTNTDARINLKIKSQADFYMIGSSRLMRIDPNIVEHYLNKHVYNVGIFGASFQENLLLASIVKKQKKNFIFGFDAFSLNSNGHNNEHYRNRMKNLKNGLDENIYMQYFTVTYFLDSLRFWFKIIKNEDKYSFYKGANKASYHKNIEEVYEKKGFGNHQGAFSNYKIYSDNDIIRLAKLADKNDIVIIYPQHFYYYILFHRYHNIQKQYFHALKVLVENTEATVWSFYEINAVTRDFNNFDAYGWHFKPMLAKSIFAEVFDDKEIKRVKNFAQKLTRDNVDAYLNDLENYQNDKARLYK